MLFRRKRKLVINDSERPRIWICFVIFAYFFVILWTFISIRLIIGNSSGSNSLSPNKDIHLIKYLIDRLSKQNTTSVQDFSQQVLENAQMQRDHFCRVETKTSFCYKRCLDRNLTNSQFQHTAIIIPYRDRLPQIRGTLANLSDHLNKTSPETCFKFVVVEQLGTLDFNKGKLMNAGFLYTIEKALPFSNCVIFHDSDLIPTESALIYSCSRYPKHLSVAVDKLSYQLPYAELIGGVLTVPVNLFLQVNGYSNMYWRWGAEDDDMYARFTAENIPILRPDINIGRYKMVKHKQASLRSLEARQLLLSSSSDRYRYEGLNSLKERATLLQIFEPGTENPFSLSPLPYDLYYLSVPIIKDVG
ncbi:hypothetical protein Ciccas_003249 [Cichlidogyrus casuarinus]|uniref:Beta-1,4-galactosyltransferase n=1 Tax=Cichlidogyrus casuarinus TaxID=1844966 RepID=A0ABD2QEZ9_9PLAT